MTFRRTAALLAALLLPLLAVAPAQAAPAPAAEGVTAEFAMSSEWGGGYVGQYTIHNDSSTVLDGWTLRFSLPSGTAVGSYWDALISSEGDEYVAVPREYNGTVPAGGSVSFGWTASGTGAPVSCTLNGAECDAGPPEPEEPPGVPENLAVSAASATTLTLSWTPAAGPAADYYEIVTDDSAPTQVDGGAASTVIRGLSPNTDYEFSIRAVNSVGASDYSEPVQGRTEDEDTQPPSDHISYAPYVDITRDSPSLVEVAEATGVTTFTLAFVLGSSAGCDPKWGGTIDLLDSRIIGQIEELRAMGGDVVIASGGALGPYLENVCGSADALYDAYVEVLDATGASQLDVDVEASIPHAMVNTALARLVRERGTSVGYTLRIQGQDYGMDPYSVQILRDAASKGLEPLVNPMLMNFGHTGDWGQAMISAAEATLGQMGEIWPDAGAAEIRSRLGITPMIGHNNSGMVTTQAHARALLSWAQSNQIGFIGFWSIGRDNGGCPGGGVSPTCSGISQSLYEFTNIFKPFA